ncbi:MAG: hypothetical protein EON58_10780, partial [Alphaproteobacteria bacterium]
MEHNLVARRDWGPFEAAFPMSKVEVLTFRNFKLVPASRSLTMDEQKVEIGSRAFDLLLALVRARGHLVAKGDLVN